MSESSSKSETLIKRLKQAQIMFKYLPLVPLLHEAISEIEILRHENLMMKSILNSRSNYGNGILTQPRPELGR